MSPAERGGPKPHVGGGAAAATSVGLAVVVEVERGLERRRIPWLVGLEAGSDTLR